MNRLEQLLQRMKALQDQFKGKPMPETEAKEFENLGQEAAVLQAEADRAKGISDVEAQVAESKRARTVTLPDDGQPEAPAKAPATPAIAGYLRIGEFVAASKGIAEFIARGMPKQNVLLAKVKSLRDPVIALTAEQLVAVKAVPTIASTVIEPTRLPELVRSTEHDRLVLRNILDIGRTGSDAVKYTRITSYTRAAAAVANSAQKPQATLAMDSVTEAVRTIAVWMPVENQQLADLAQLAGLINVELLYDVDKHIEELITYGDGLGENFAGILPDTAVLACRTEGGDTLIDIIRRGITDVRRAGYEPNGILADPLDWEEIVLLKGSDNRYLWVIVTEGAVQRLWSVPVIETVAMQNYEGVETEQRHLLVGDFLRGATLWDREDASISVGWINDQFIRNQRTILAEYRGAFGVKRPGAFRKHETQAASAS